jgi:hypothetical protein
VATLAGNARTTAPRARRADALRNVEAILDTAVACLARDPEASVVDIAAAAGVGSPSSGWASGRRSATARRRPAASSGWAI